MRPSSAAAKKQRLKDHSFGGARLCVPPHLANEALQACERRRLCASDVVASRKYELRVLEIVG